MVYQQQIDPITISILILSSFLLLYMLLTMLSKREKPEEKPKILTELTCEKGDYSTKRDFKEGDYVGKEDGECPKCGSKLVIAAIYSEKAVTTTKA